MALLIGNVNDTILGGMGSKNFYCDETSIFGVDFNQYAGSKATLGDRTDDAVGFRFNPCKPDDKDTKSDNTRVYQYGTDDFIINSPIFKPRECCIHTDDLKNSDYSKIIYKDSISEESWIEKSKDSDYNVMVEFSKFYYKRPGLYKFQVSGTKHDGFECSPMHYRGGVEYDYCYISKYPICKTYLSNASDLPLGAHSMSIYGPTAALSTVRSKIRSTYPNTLYLLDYQVWCSITMLMFIKYAEMNIFPLIPTFATNAAPDTVDYKTNGATMSIPGLDGYLTTNLATEGNKCCAAVNFGLENWYGGVPTTIDGLFIWNGSVYMANDSMSLTANPGFTTLENTSVYTCLTPSAYADTSGYWVDFKDFTGTTTPYALLPSSVTKLTGLNKSQGDWFKLISHIQVTYATFGGSSERNVTTDTNIVGGSHGELSYNHTVGLSCCGPLCLQMNWEASKANPTAFRTFFVRNK